MYEMYERKIGQPDTSETPNGTGSEIAEQPDNIIEKLRQSLAFKTWLSGQNITRGADFIDTVEVSVPNDFTQLCCGCVRKDPAQTPWTIKRNAFRPNIYHTACGSVIGEIDYCPLDL